MSSDRASQWALFPMHGEVKLRNEGIRTRDGHLIEWLSRLSDARIDVISRAEPWPRLTLARSRRPRPPFSDHVVLTSPEPKVWPMRFAGTRRVWWSESVRWVPPVSPKSSVMFWNPIAAGAIAERGHAGLFIVDLLDDWTIHPLFAPIRDVVAAAYRSALARADVVTANAEGTVELARRYGRDDVVLITNGVDPERFSAKSAAAGTRTVVGYAGKIGSRLDIALIENVATAYPEVSFVFAGPVMERCVGASLKRISNVALVGDVHYDEYADLLRHWDVAWVPHRVGEGEIGGDVIKTYEYRASGLPTISTPVMGAGRLSGVRVVDAHEIVGALAALLGEGPRVAREPTTIPAEHTWAHKARVLRNLAGLRI
jgi:glycosyltransferase involved in cell wall biosynthesis